MQKWENLLWVPGCLMEPKCRNAARLEDKNGTRYFFFFFFKEPIFHQVNFHFKNLWKNNLRPLSNFSYPFSGLSSGSCRPVCSGRLNTPVCSEELLNRCRRHLQAFRPVHHLRLSSSELWSWSGTFTLKFLLGHSLLSCLLLFLFSLLRISVEAEIRHDLPWVFTEDGTHTCAGLPKWASTTSDPLSELPS